MEQTIRDGKLMERTGGAAPAEPAGRSVIEDPLGENHSAIRQYEVARKSG